MKTKIILYLYLKDCKNRNSFSMEMKLFLNQINETLLMINENIIVYTNLKKTVTKSKDIQNYNILSISLEILKKEPIM